MASRRPTLTCMKLSEISIDASNIQALIEIVAKNPLRTLDMQGFIKGKQVMIPYQELFTALAERKTLESVVVRDRNLRVNPVIA